jgi:Na+/citrate or Na+/malate symporter
VFDSAPNRRGHLPGRHRARFEHGEIRAEHHFVLAVAIGQGERRRWLGNIVGVLCAAALAAVGNWIPFGAGDRHCSSSVSAFLFASSRAAGNIECRAAFGIAAAMLDGIVLWMLGSALVRQFGPGWVPRAIETIGKWVFLMAAAHAKAGQQVAVAGPEGTRAGTIHLGAIYDPDGLRLGA